MGTRNNTYQGKTNLGTFEKIVLFIFVSQLFVLPEYLRELMILNVGWGNIYPLRFYTVGLPALYVFHLCYTRRQFKSPHLYPFLLLFGGFMFMESLPFRESPAAYSFIDMIPFLSMVFPGRVITYSFALEQFNIYIFFLLLVNLRFNRTTFYKAIDYAIYAGLITCAVTYMGYFGFIDLGATYLFMDAGFSGRPDTVFNPNQVSHICSFSILLLIIKQLNERKYSNLYILRDTVAISLLFAMIVLNSTRGAFIMALILVVYYCYMFLRFNVTRRKRLLLFPVLFVLVVGSYKIIPSGIPKQTNLYQRFFIHSAEATGSATRMRNISNTLDNLNSHPFIGVGYQNAAKTENRYGTRSNNQFLHILASCGILYFFLYLFYNFNLLVCKLTLLRRPEVMLSLLFQVSYLMFRRPSTLALLSVSAYIAIYFYYESKRELTA